MGLFVDETDIKETSPSTENLILFGKKLGVTTFVGQDMSIKECVDLINQSNKPKRFLVQRSRDHR